MDLRKIALAVLMVALVVGGRAAAHDPPQHGFQMVAFTPPMPAPAFELSRLSGGTAGLGDFRGSYVLLNFWATWCPPCVREMPSMDALYTRLMDQGLVVVAVSSDQEGAAIVQDFVDRLGVSFPILLDSDGAVSASYGARNLPTSLLLDRQGRVIAAAQGARDWGSDEAVSYVEELLAAP